MRYQIHLCSCGVTCDSHRERDRLAAAVEKLERQNRDGLRMLASVVRGAGGEVTVFPKAMRQDHVLGIEEGLDGRITFTAAWPVPCHGDPGDETAAR